MDAISMARELGKQIQADERYKAYHTARETQRQGRRTSEAHR